MSLKRRPGHLEHVERERPELAGYAALVREVLAEIERGRWRDAARGEARRAGEPCGGKRPRLAGLVISLDARRLRRWIDRLLGLTPAWGRGRQRRSLWREDGDARAALEAALAFDEERIAELRARWGEAGPALETVLNLAVMPLLHAVREEHSREIEPAWDHAACPVCGALAVLAELRGLERARRLRCGRCGADWGAPPLRCPYCGTCDTQHLAALVVEGEAGRQVDVCESCGGYLKAVATLTAIPPTSVAVEDLSTVELDLLALDRGYGRPDPPPLDPPPRLVAAPRPGWPRWP